MTRSFDPEGARDIVFIPVGINYDRTFEDLSQLISLGRGAGSKNLPSVIGTTVKFVLRNLLLMLRGRWFRFGYACVNFGSPLSMKEHSRSLRTDFRAPEREERFRHVEALAGELMTSVGRVIPVLPVSLVATVFLNHRGDGLSELELKAEAHRLLASLSSAGAHIYIPRKDDDYAVTVGLRMLTLRHLVKEEDGLYAADPGNLPLLRYFANSIRHLLPSPVGH